MSIAEQLTKAQNNLINARQAIVDKGGSVDVTPKFDNLANEIITIPSIDPSYVRVEDSGVAYTTGILAGAIPLAKLKSVGGMTYKSTNILTFEPRTYTYRDVTYVMEDDGGITVSGTPTAGSECVLKSDIPITSNYLYVKNFGTYANVTCRLKLYDADGSEVATKDTFESNDINVASTYPTAVKYHIAIARRANNVECTGTIYPVVSTSPITEYSQGFDGLRTTAVTEVATIGENLLTFLAADSKNQSSVIYTPQADGGVAVTGTPTGSSSYTLNTISVAGLAGFWITSYGTFSNVSTRCNLKTADGKTPLAKDVRKTPFYVDLSQYPTVVAAQIQIARYETGVECSGTIYPMISINKPTAFRQYRGTSFVIPEAVQALEGYGLGVNADYNNHISWDEDGTPKWNVMVKRVVLTGTEKWTKQGDNPFYAGTLDTTAKAGDTLICSHYKSAAIGNTTTAIGAYFVSSTSLRVRPDTTEIPTVDAWKAYLAEQYAAGTPVTVDYVIATPEVTDISDLITSENYIDIEGNGTLTFENEYQYAAPYHITYLRRA